MSIFSNIRKSRQQAKEHNAKLAEQKRKDLADATPYRHVPTHAAADAFASAPPSWREVSDRPRIIEQNRRRSAMTASGQAVNFPMANFPRVGSSLSIVSYPGPKAPISRMPRAHSYAGVSPYADGSRDIIYSIPDVAHSELKCVQGNAPVDSNSDSTSSLENLEMKHSKPHVASSADTAEMPPAHRLQPVGRSQLTSEPRTQGSTRDTSGSQTPGLSASRDPRPPPSTRCFASGQLSSRSSSRLGRFAEMESSAPLENEVDNESLSLPHSDTINSFPEPVAKASYRTASTRSKANRLSKAGGGKLLRRSRQ